LKKTSEDEKIIHVHGLVDSILWKWLLKAIYILYTISKNNPMSFFAEIEKSILKSKLKNERHWRAKIIPNKTSKSSFQNIRLQSYTTET
jgi:hypothetical protein